MKVVEIFDSMQGEGYWQGIYCTFVRFAGCNLTCPFCDEHTKYERAQDMELEEIVTQCKQLHIVLTGGEPTLQPLLRTLITHLQKSGHIVHIETNGTNPVTVEDVWVTCSPKPQNSFKINTRCDEIKLVVDGVLTLEKAMEIAKEHRMIVYLQPCDGPDIKDSKAQIQEWITKEPTLFRAGIQMHKWYGAY